MEPFVTLLSYLSTSKILNRLKLIVVSSEEGLRRYFNALSSHTRFKYHYLKELPVVKKSVLKKAIIRYLKEFKRN